MTAELKKVYCFQVGDGDCFKVGRTKNAPETRMRGFATGSPLRFTLYRCIETDHSSALEKYIHQLLDEKRAENGEFFNVSTQELDEAVDQAVLFMEEFQPTCREAKELARKKPNDTLIEPQTEMLEVYRRLRTLTRERYLIEQQIDFLVGKIQLAIGDSCGMKGIASWKWVERETLDVERFKKEQAALYGEYKRDSSSRKFVLERVDLTRTD